MRAIWIGPNPFKFTSKITFKPFEVIEFDPKWFRMMRARGVKHRLLEADLVRRQLAAGKYRDSEVMRFARLAFGLEEAAKIESVGDATALLMDHLYDSKARALPEKQSPQEATQAPKVNLMPSENTEPSVELNSGEIENPELYAEAKAIGAIAEMPDVSPANTGWNTPAERASVVRSLKESGETIAQIAEAVGVSASTVRKDLSRAK
jgi:DNA-binding transcriptional ArsR family regulator